MCDAEEAAALGPRVEVLYERLVLISVVSKTENPDVMVVGTDMTSGTPITVTLGALLPVLAAWSFCALPAALRNTVLARSGRRGPHLPWCTERRRAARRCLRTVAIAGGRARRVIGRGVGGLSGGRRLATAIWSIRRRRG